MWDGDKNVIKNMEAKSGCLKDSRMQRQGNFEREENALWKIVSKFLEKSDIKKG